jgi:hypothetical protein
VAAGDTPLDTRVPSLAEGEDEEANEEGGEEGKEDEDEEGEDEDEDDDDKALATARALELKRVRANSLGPNARALEAQAEAAEDFAAEAAEDLLSRRIDALIVRQSRSPHRNSLSSIGELDQDAQQLAERAQAQAQAAAIAALQAQMQAESLARALAQAQLRLRAADDAAAMRASGEPPHASTRASTPPFEHATARAALSVPPPVPWGVRAEYAPTPHRLTTTRRAMPTDDSAFRIALGLPPRSSAA